MTGLQGLLGALLLPPVLLVLLGILAGLLAWRGRHWAGLLGALAGLGLLLLATPLVAGLLLGSLEWSLVPAVPSAAPAPPAAAIIILGGDLAHGRAGPEIGMLTLERLRAGAALHRATGQPILVTGGALAEGEPPLANLMARSLWEDFQVPVRWIEPRAADTRENARFASAMLRADGVAAALLVTQGWHMPRARDSFAREGFAVQAMPVRTEGRPGLAGSDLLPRGDHLAESWFALHEWAGRLVYLVRDGPVPAAPGIGPARRLLMDGTGEVIDLDAGARL
jgi:uncharacterized SAM-binding protein YcdF (DUF218 family)